jgi:peptide deformylase
LAAPQIAVPLRIFVIAGKAFLYDGGEEISGKAVPPDMVFINPEIVKLSKKTNILPEGCLSVRWLYGKTVRAEKAKVRAYDEHGKRFEYGGSGLIAQIFQHETDHLNGILFTDHAVDIKDMPPESHPAHTHANE